MTEVDKEPVLVIPHDPRWPKLFKEERGRIAAALGDRILAIEHIGSTAVPGLGAKPLIDIMVGLRQLADGEVCIGPLEELGYEYRGEAGIPRRLFFRKFTDGVRTHHLHMADYGGDFWETHLQFRDYLREHPDEAQRYYELKVQLAEQFRMKRVAYTEAKTDYIRTVLAKAKASELKPGA